MVQAVDRRVTAMRPVVGCEASAWILRIARVLGAAGEAGSAARLVSPGAVLEIPSEEARLVAEALSGVVDAASRSALDELARLSEELGLYDDGPGPTDSPC